MAFFLPQGPPPAVGASVRYQYHTLDGGPPNDGKPPGPVAGPPPPYSQFPFCSPPPAAPGPGFPFCAPQSPAPGPTFCCSLNGPHAVPGGPPSMVCWSQPQPPQPPQPVVLAPGPPALSFAPSRLVSVAAASRAHPPDPGNRVNNRVVKADDGTGVICPEDMTTFHVLNPGRWYDENMTVSHLRPNVDFKVQHAPSDMTVQTFIKQLGADQAPRLSMKQVAKKATELICIEQWHESGDGKFERGSNVFYNDQKAQLTLRSVGWGPEHGKAGQQPPVWVMFYPINDQLMNR